MKRKAPIPPTWPKSVDQRKQSRPLIYIKPLRHLAQALYASNGGRALTAEQHSLIRAMRNAPRPWIERAIAEAA
jgi:hypothetical protein